MDHERKLASSDSADQANLDVRSCELNSESSDIASASEPKPVVPWETITTAITFITLTTIYLSAVLAQKACFSNQLQLQAWVHPFSLLVQALNEKLDRDLKRNKIDARKPTPRRRELCATIGALSDAIDVVLQRFMLLRENAEHHGFWPPTRCQTVWYNVGFFEGPRWCLPFCVDWSVAGVGSVIAEFDVATIVSPSRAQYLTLERQIDRLLHEILPTLVPEVRHWLRLEGFSAAHLAYLNGDSQMARELWQKDSDEHDLLGTSLCRLLWPANADIATDELGIDHTTLPTAFNSDMSPLVVNTGLMDTEQLNAALPMLAQRWPINANDMPHLAVGMNANMTDAFDDIDAIGESHLQDLAGRTVRTFDFDFRQQ